MSEKDEAEECAKLAPIGSLWANTDWPQRTYEVVDVDKNYVRVRRDDGQHFRWHYSSLCKVPDLRRIKQSL